MSREGLGPRPGDSHRRGPTRSLPWPAGIHNRRARWRLCAAPGRTSALIRARLLVGGARGDHPCQSSGWRRDPAGFGRSPTRRDRADSSSEMRMSQGALPSDYHQSGAPRCPWIPAGRRTAPLTTGPMPCHRYGAVLTSSSRPGPRPTWAGLAFRHDSSRSSSCVLMPQHGTHNPMENKFGLVSTGVASSLSDQGRFLTCASSLHMSVWVDVIEGGMMYVHQGTRENDANYFLTFDYVVSLAPSKPTGSLGGRSGRPCRISPIGSHESRFFSPSPHVGEGDQSQCRVITPPHQAFDDMAG